MHTESQTMDRRINNSLSILFLLISLTPLFNDIVVAESTNEQQSFAPKAFLISYWRSKVSHGLPQSQFLLDKASPLTASQCDELTKLATQNTLSSNIHQLCSQANLFCLLRLTHTAQKSPQGLLGGNDPPQENKGTGQANNTDGMQFANYNMQFSAYEVNKNNTGSSFTNYSDETNFGVAVFKDYSKEGRGGSVDFRNYSHGASFAQYSNESNHQIPEPESLRRPQTNSVPKKLVEPGKFFRESELKEGNVMPMPDIRDKMPKRSYLPRSIASEIPFSSSRVNEIKEIFHAADNSSMEWVILNALTACEANPSLGEIKKCVSSIEDMIDFATSVLGRNCVVRETENVNGSSKNVMIGSLKAINGGNVTKAVSCHQSLYPYMMHYCHSVPKVRVYEADILDVNTRQKINHGVAICHLDTSTWSPLHEAFVALGSSPGKIEVCHWIFQNDMTWTLAH